MDLRHLECFLRVAELGSINRAAQTLAMSQPALSRQIGALEHDMGVHLFARTPSGVRLTEPGRLLNERARPLLRQFEMLKTQVGEEAAGQLALGVPPAWQVFLTGPLAGAFVKRHAGVKLRIHEGLSNVLHESMAAGLLDLAVVPFQAMPATGYRQQALVREPLVVVGPTSEGFVPSTPVGMAALAGRDLVLPERPNVLRVQIERALARRALPHRVVAETDSLPICLDLARRGHGLTVVPCSALLGYAGPLPVSHAPLRGQQVTWAVMSNMARDHASTLRQGRLALAETLAAAVIDGRWPGAELVDDPAASVPHG